MLCHVERSMPVPFSKSGVPGSELRPLSPNVPPARVPCPQPRLLGQQRLALNPGAVPSTCQSLLCCLSPAETWAHFLTPRPRCLSLENGDNSSHCVQAAGAFEGARHPGQHGDSARGPGGARPRYGPHTALGTATRFHLHKNWRLEASSWREVFMDLSI